MKTLVDYGSSLYCVNPIAQVILPLLPHFFLTLIFVSLIYNPIYL